MLSSCGLQTCVPQLFERTYSLQYHAKNGSTNELLHILFATTTLSFNDVLTQNQFNIQPQNSSMTLPNYVAAAFLDAVNNKVPVELSVAEVWSLSCKKVIQSIKLIASLDFWS